ncbi:MAG: winged helix-turn-helix transcriptional regulator [Sedimentisphaerales bacterium]|nr:winged helix-turn-helix transcriptional regulator [Sedimentisphaerales bacterium]
MVRRPNNRNIVMIFRALSLDSRLRIVQLLSQRSLCVGAISNLLGMSSGAVSQHLRVLKDAGLVRAERRGYFIHYTVVPDAAARCQAAIESLLGSKKGDKQCDMKTKCQKPKELKGKPEK